MSREVIVNSMSLQDAIQVFRDTNAYGTMDIAKTVILKALEQEPKTGRWVVDGFVDCYLDKARCHCSECGKKKNFPADYNHITQELSISYKYPELIYNYCLNCGAKMESEDEE